MQEEDAIADEREDGKTCNHAADEGFE